MYYVISFMYHTIGILTHYQAPRFLESCTNHGRQNYYIIFIDGQISVELAGLTAFSFSNIVSRHRMLPKFPQTIQPKKEWQRSSHEANRARQVYCKCCNKGGLRGMCRFLLPSILYGRFRTEHMYRTHVLIPVADQTTIQPRVPQIPKSICECTRVGPNDL